MAALRRQHAGRDFLQENKNNVSRMETNGRCLAAANARRVPLWRPVVLHYPEKLRPHSQTIQRRTRHYHAASYETPDLRSGLAYPYGFKDNHRRRVPPPCGCELHKRDQQDQERARAQGGWIDPKREQKQKLQHQMRRKCCHECHCKQEVDRLAAGAEAEAKQEIAPPAEAPPPAEDTMSMCSRVSRMSGRSKKSSVQEEKQDAPLSARSGASAKTLRSKRSPSQESIRSNATVRSNMSGISRQSTTSKKSGVSQGSRKSQLMEVMPPPQSVAREHEADRKEEKDKDGSSKQEPTTQYDGYTPLTPKERQAALQDAQYKYGKLIEEYNHLPVSEPTLRVRTRKIAIERQLDELDYAINMFDQPHLEMYYKR
ncbi:uncharacterized protein LOC6502180 [Drosophila ananassae]|uniref:uncharacterized protein LOC6502180 n=1 Tax=Drosophila ananassae TaxID=7217 RepID=UPI0013A5EF90|nr:uncharacterized protein LOC6502180 [Drosophila ananassae]